MLSKIYKCVIGCSRNYALSKILLIGLVIISFKAISKLSKTRAVTERDKCPRRILVIKHLLHVECGGKK
jgi:hypothetical protein